MELVTEVVPHGTFETDHGRKTLDYATMQIPTYLIVNPCKSTITAFSNPGPAPKGTRYRARNDHMFGDQITAGGYAIDSGAFLPYEDDA